MHFKKISNFHVFCTQTHAKCEFWANFVPTCEYKTSRDLATDGPIFANLVSKEVKEKTHEKACRDLRRSRGSRGFRTDPPPPPVKIGLNKHDPGKMAQGKIYKTLNLSFSKNKHNFIKYFSLSCIILAPVSMAYSLSMEHSKVQIFYFITVAFMAIEFSIIFKLNFQHPWPTELNFHIHSTKKESGHLFNSNYIIY